MAGSTDLLVRAARAPRLPSLTVTVAVLVLVPTAVALAQHHGPRGPTQLRAVLVVTAVNESGEPTQRILTLSNRSAERLVRDLAALQPGRISCGSPGPRSASIRFASATYDVNGECARVVRRGTTTAFVESAALHDDLAALARD